MKVLSSLVLISDMLTSLPRNGPNRVPFVMTDFLQNTP
jgi:hypothetical protein